MSRWRALGLTYILVKISRSIDTCQPIGGNRANLVCVCSYFNICLKIRCQQRFKPANSTIICIHVLCDYISAKSLVGLDSNRLILLLIVYYVFRYQQSLWWG